MNNSPIYKEDIAAIREAVPNINMLSHSSVLVTGAGGLIGSGIVDFLLELNRTKQYDISIYAGLRTEKNFLKRFGCYENPKLHFVEYDALKPFESGVKFNYIIHTASPANPAVYGSMPVETMLANFHGMNALLSYASKNDVKRVMFLSSGEVYGNWHENKAAQLSYQEEDYGLVDILNPRACYPSSKRASETLCVSYAKEYGVDSVIVRPGHIYGPTATKTDVRASSAFFRDAVKGHDIIMKSPGTQMRSYCYVMDCISAILTVLLNGTTAEAYNIANPDSDISIRQLAEYIAEAAGVSVQFKNPTDAERAGYNLMDYSCLNAEKLMNLGWNPLFDAKTGILHTIRIMRENNI